VTATGLIAGYGADLMFGDPRRGHPVAGFGALATSCERAAYAPSRARGAFYAGALVLSAAGAAEALARVAPRTVVLAAAGWAAIGGRSLRAVALGIGGQLRVEDLEGARAALPALCGRDPAALAGPEIVRAVVESVAENTGDAVVGPLFWGAALGPAGVVAYRAANTLDAMVGHRNERYERFGWASARLDDLMSWPAARVGAALACLTAPVVGGSPAAAARALRRDGARHPSPNAGRMEAAFAGALGLQLGGRLSYGGLVEDRPALGSGRAPEPADIERAARLSLAVGALAAALAAAARARLDRGFLRTHPRRAARVRRKPRKAGSAAHSPAPTAASAQEAPGRAA
jgi:adenosylcobinamide-phosphate synthase